MIDESVLNLSVDFASHWNGKLSRYPRYQLDLSWPSVGTLDLLLDPLRAKKTLHEFETLLLRGASAYIAGLAYDCWSQFPEKPAVEVYFKDSDPNGDVIIETKGGPLIKENESYFINITEALRSTIRDRPNPLPTFSDGLRYITPDTNVVSSICAGILSGISPYGNGKWSTIRPEDFPDPLSVTIRQLAESSAENYVKVYPSEMYGGSPRLYQPSLILPPLGFDETVFGARAASGLVDYLLSNVSEHAARVDLCSNLARSTDELISTAAFCTLVALEDSLPSAILRAVASNRKLSLPTLRKTISLSRVLLGKTDSWLDDLKNEEFDTAMRGLSRELILDVLPLWYLEDRSLLKEPSLLTLFELLAHARIEDSMLLIKRTLITEIRHPELYLQHCFLLLVRGKLDEAHEELAWLEKQDSNSLPTVRFKTLELQAMLQEQRGEVAESAELREAALKIEKASSFRHKFVALWLARHYTKQGHVDKALRYYEYVSKIDEFNFESSYEVHRIHKSMQISGQDAPSSIQKLLSLCPTHHGLFLELLEEAHAPQ